MRDGVRRQEVLDHLREWKAWMARKGEGPVPAFVNAFRVEESRVQLLGTVVFHVPLAVLFAAASGLRLHRTAARIARLRIATDRWSYEPVQCGLNSAYCNLGLAYVRLGSIDEAIDCLEEAWRVYPCPHNTSFGLKMNLCRALSPHPRAAESIARHERMAAAFVVS